MFKKTISGMLGFVLLAFIASSSLQAQIKTDTYNNREVKKNSIIVKYDDSTISIKGKTTNSKNLVETVRGEINARVSLNLEKQNVEEWSISTDMESTLKKLNSIPGVRAFPNYIFHRDDFDPQILNLDDSKTRINSSMVSIDPRRPLTGFEPKGNSIGLLESFTSNPKVYWESFSDSVATDSTWIVRDYSGSDVFWKLSSDSEGGHKFLIQNDTGEDTTVSSDVYSPLFDLSGLDSTKKYVLRFDFENEFVGGTYLAFFFESDSASNEFDISLVDGQLSMDITDLVGQLFQFGFYAENELVGIDEILAGFDNVYIEEYGTNDDIVDLQYALYNDGSFNPGISVPGADISAFDAWGNTRGSDDVIVVVYDDGVDFDHEDLATNAWVNPIEDLNGDGEITPDEWNGVDDDGNGYIDDFWGWSAVYDDNSYLNSGSYHGTHVAGILGAQGGNRVGVSGVSQDVSIISVMIFDEYGSTDAISIMRGYDYISTLLENGTEITAINQSWGGGGLYDYESDIQFVNVMTDFALHHNEFGALWVISAGNNGGDRDIYPYYSYPNNIQSPNIITVANTNDAEEISGSSDFGLRTVDIGAPGSNILSTLPENKYGYLSGTSMASPQVTGALALAKSLYPEESGQALIARLLAGTDILDQYASYFGDGGRLNTNKSLNPTSEGIDLDLLPSHVLAKFHRTLIDGAATRTVGFINNTNGEVTVTDVSISGTDADKFFVWNEFASEIIPAGGSFGVALGFDNEGEVGEFTATVNISTSNGDVDIALNGLEQTFGDLEISPVFADLGAVPYGTELETSFTITNEGVGDLNFGIRQSLYLNELEFSERVDDLTKYKAPINIATKSKKAGKEELIEELTAKVYLERGNRQLPKITYSPSLRVFDGPETVFFDNLNNADSVDYYWDIINFGEGDVWELVDIGDSSGVNNVFLMGDFSDGYSPNTITVATPPIFDFTALEHETRPAYLKFDVEASLEDFYDDFFVNVISNGTRLTTLGGTFDGSVVNNGGYYTVYYDISMVTGLDNVEFWFIATSDEDYAGGFGALFDNVEILVTDAEFFASEYSGTLSAGESQEIDVSIKTELLPPGDWELVTGFESDEFISAYEEASYHLTAFSSRVVNVALTPEFSYLGEVSGEEPLNFSFTAENVGIVDVNYYAQTIFTSSDIFASGLVKNLNPLKEDVLARFENQSEKKGTSKFNPNSHRLFLESRSDISKLGKASISKNTIRPRVKPSLEDVDIYFEDFETGVLSEDWFVDDQSFGLGHSFEVINVGSESSPINGLFVGDLEGGYILDNTFTAAYTPIFDFSTVPNGEEISLDFSYNVLLEPGYDFGSVWIGVVTDSGLEFYLLGSTEDVIYNDGNFYRSSIDLTEFREFEEVFMVFVVETDYITQSGWAFIDDIDIYTTENIAYISPESGVIDSAEAQLFDVTVNTQWLYPGDYTALTILDYFSFETFSGNIDFQETAFSIANEAPVAVDDTLAILAGDVVPVDDWLWYGLLSNDYDEYGEVYLYDYSDPIYGSLKYVSENEPWVYVAPLNYDGYDYLQYIITDGSKTDTGMVYISVHAQPEFVKGSDQQYVFLEDNNLVLSTTGMAAGVGGQDKGLMVWASSHHESVSIDHNGSNHTLSLSATENFFGQVSAEFYVGYPGEAVLDSMTVSIVVIPVNDAPIADFSIESEGQSITFKDASNDNLDMSSGGIVKWEWNFGDGNTSEEKNPIHNYSEAGDYTVTLTVTDNGGLSSSFEQQVPVSVSNEDLESIPTEFSLKQNYPNPFNPSTVISYSIPEASKVSIVVYDMLGQKVAELVNAQKAVGNYTLSFNASGLSSGVYIYQIRAGKFTETKKMLLIK